jgi:iron complex transport system ATP-binding protein
VLRRVSFVARAGAVLNVIGQNGSGKSSLLLAALGVLPMSGGTLTLAGRPFGSYSIRERARLIAYVPQGAEIYGSPRVMDVVMTGRFPYQRPLAAPSAADWQAVRDAIALVGLTDLAERPIGDVSAGERQRALLAAALAQAARVLVLDEPDAALDVGWRIRLGQVLSKWVSAEWDRFPTGLSDDSDTQPTTRAIIMVSHDLQLAGRMGGETIALQAGELVDHGATREVLSPQRLTAVYDAPFSHYRSESGEWIAAPKWNGKGGGE